MLTSNSLNNEKTSLIATLLLMIVGVVGGLNAYYQSQAVNSSDLTIANIEALAGEDSGGETNPCFGSKFKVTETPEGWDCENDKGDKCCPI